MINFHRNIILNLLLKILVSIDESRVGSFGKSRFLLKWYVKMLLFLYVEAQINHVLFIVVNISIKANSRRNRTG